jgi:hypothetical protein
VGDVLALDADTLSLAIRNEARPLDLALPDVALLELRTDSRSNAKAGAIWGLVVGALSGLILSGGEAADQGSNGSEVAATAAEVCGLAGAAAGALIGAAIHTEHWQTVSPPWTTGSLHGRPSRPGGASVGLVFVRF